MAHTQYGDYKIFPFPFNYKFNFTVFYCKAENHQHLPFSASIVVFLHCFLS